MLAGFDEPYRSSPAAPDVSFGTQTAPGTLLPRQEPGMPDTPGWLADAGRESSLDQRLAGHARHRLADGRRDGSELDPWEPLEDVLSLLADRSSGRRGDEASDPYDTVFALLGR
ncbi:MAG: hypothetical protein EA424_18705 [Planctomycetaceae bacterium]|nr:MAG: hypothetical protein EA424_18705 [Planctomycetaceae bacterium]